MEWWKNLLLILKLNKFIQLNRNTAHHHFALAVLFIFVGHMYRTNWGVGHKHERNFKCSYKAFTLNILHTITKICIKF